MGLIYNDVFYFVFESFVMVVGRSVDGWVLLSFLQRIEGVCEQFKVHDEDGHEGILSLYEAGAEPDTQIYDVLKQLPRAHTPDILATGRWQERAYEVMEPLSGQTLADLGVVLHSLPELCSVVSELGTALHAFAQVGLRHRGICPEVLMVRTQQPLDLVVSGFGSACLSEYDLEVVSTLNLSVYMAPEAVMGAVSAASDWWSLGMVLLEQLTGSTCFKGQSPYTFLLHTLTHGVVIPDHLDASLQALLAGLLTHDHEQRWQWAEVNAWLDEMSGRMLAGALSDPMVNASTFTNASQASNEVGRRVESERPLMAWGEQVFDQPAEFALAVACWAGWSQGLALLAQGKIHAWVSVLGWDADRLGLIARIKEEERLNPDMRLMLVLKVLNPKMPLVYEGSLVTPLWVLDHPVDGYALIRLAAPFLEELGALGEPEHQRWYMRLHKRIKHVRRRAMSLHIKLDEERLREHLLCTSHAQLAARAHQQYLVYPDAFSAGLLSLMERRNPSNEDLIVLLSAQTSQLVMAQGVLEEVEALAEACGVYFDAELAQTYMALPRLALYTLLDERAEGMAVTGHAQIDSWIEQYRLEKRMPMARLLVLLMYPKEQWLLPQKHQYTQNLLDFFEKKVAFSGLIGPLVRMRIGRYTPRMDLTLLNRGQAKLEDLLNGLLARKNQVMSTIVVNNRWEAYSKVTSLAREADVYQRDTGIDALYMGFPFVLYQEPRSHRLARIAPLFLWPVNLGEGWTPEGLWKASLAFDRAREEVRMNPALENIFGKTVAQQWAGILDELMRRSTLTMSDVMECFADVGKIWGTDEVMALPTDFELEEGKPEFVPSAVLFMVNFTGQALGEDLRALKGLPLAGTALEKVLRLDEKTHAGEVERAVLAEDERYLVVGSDPSQERAVLQAREPSGLLIEGPPGTGKSQTIVNLVADSLGRGQTMLIVCQKKAALDVVHKRLVAEGLASRTMMVGDINADRNRVINHVREQLAQLKHHHAASIQALTIQRQALGRRMGELERGLDAYHESLNAVDVQTGLSYRQMVAELIRFSKDDAGLSLPMLQPFVNTLSQEGLAHLGAEVSAVLSQWLPAHYEGSPFENLRMFPNDAMAAGIFKRALQDFLNIEQEVVQASREQPTPVQVKSDPQAFRAWMSAHMDELIQLTGEPRQQLIRWLPLFQAALPGQTPELASQTVGGDLLEKFRHLLRLLKQVPLVQWQERYSPQIARLDDAGLNTLEKQASVMAAPQPWYAFLSLSRRQYQRNITNQLQLWGAVESGASDQQPDFAAFRDALRLEQQWRPLRQELQRVCDALKLPVPTADSGPELLTYAQSCFHALKQVAQWAEVMSAFPDEKTLTMVLRGSDVQALERLRIDYEIAFVHYALRQKWMAALEKLAPYFSDYLLEACRYAIRHHVQRPDVITQMSDELSRLDAYLAFRDKVPHLSAEAKELLACLQSSREYLQSISEDALTAEFTRALKKEAFLLWKARVERENPHLLQSRAVWEQRIAELEQADGEMRQLNRDFLMQQGLDQVASEKAWESVTRLRGKRALRLREFIEQGEKLGLMKLRPIWLLNPDVASRLLPLKAGLFDVVVYDEASQMSVEFALPTLFRGKRVVVSGDEKQMPPSSFFTAQVEADEEDMLMADVVHGNINDDDWDEAQSEWNSQEIQDCPDLLQLARTVLPGTTLQIHYRSAYRELIAFSNAAFYASQLNVPVRHPEKRVFEAKPIELIQVQGVYHEQRNEDEAKRVVKVLEALWKKPMDQRPSVGVVTFNKKQASLIEQLLHQYAAKDSVFWQALMEERQRFEAGEDMSVFVKNVENVQGDERDIIIFSTTFGYNRDHVFRRNFGVLGQQGGERRLNVGITRARQKVILVSSMPIEDISDMLVTQRTPRMPRDYLQGYLEYARLLSGADVEAANHLLERMELAHGLSKANRLQKGNGLRDAVESYLQELGVRYQKASGEDAFYLDFVIEDPKTGLYVLGVECDAPCHPLLAQARAREVWRPKVLGRVIPKMHRITSPHWLQYEGRERACLKTAIQEALGEHGDE